MLLTGPARTKAGRLEKEILKTATSPVPGTVWSSIPAPARMPTTPNGESSRSRLRRGMMGCMWEFRLMAKWQP